MQRFRNDYLNLYYNCDNIAKIKNTRKKIVCEIDSNYLDGKRYTGKEKRFRIEPFQIITQYETIKANSDKKATLEKRRNLNWFS